jgi:voltage-gated potassium channel
MAPVHFVTALRRWKFTFLVLMLLFLNIMHPFISGNAALFTLVYTLFIIVFVFAFLILFRSRGSRTVAAALGLPTVAAVSMNYLLPSASPALEGLLFHLFPALFLFFTVVVILETIFRDAVVSADSLNGALGGYLLLGLAFSHLYCLVLAFRPDAFILNEKLGDLPSEGGARHSLFTYFSFITLTTLGYGDITPRSPGARTLAWVEAMIGQFYVAVIVAELIALKVSAALRDQPHAAQSTDSKRPEE